MGEFWVKGPKALDFLQRVTKDKEAYRKKHESNLILYEAAAKALKKAGITKLPDLSAWL